MSDSKNRYFMETEIFSQPNLIDSSINNRISFDNSTLLFPEIENSKLIDNPVSAAPGYRIENLFVRWEKKYFMELLLHIVQINLVSLVTFIKVCD